MADDGLERAIEKLVAEANEESAAAKAAHEEAVRALHAHLLERRTFRSSIAENGEEALKEAYQAQLAAIQRELDESLQALYREGAEEPGEPDPEPDPGGTTEPGGDGAPYEVDYTLPMQDRYMAVKNYYLSYADMAEALADLQEDETAENYLGRYYDYLVQLLLMLQS